MKTSYMTFYQSCSDNKIRATASSAIVILIGLASTIYVCSWTSYGLDFTDEFASLNWISDPYLYGISISQFGFFYHGLFVMISEDISLLRTFSIVSCIGIELVSATNCRHDGLDRITSLCFSIPFGFVSVLSFWNWLITPNYNILNLQGLLITAIGLVRLDLSARGLR